MTNGQYYRILEMLLRVVEENPTKEAYHIYNQFKRQLRKEFEDEENDN